MKNNFMVKSKFMMRNKFIGIDANEANLIQNRVGSNQFAYGLLKAIERNDRTNKYLIYLSTKRLLDMPLDRDLWKYRFIPPPRLWTQWRLPLDLYFNRSRPSVFFSLSHYVPRFSPVPRVVVVTDLGYLKYPEQLQKKDLLQLTLWTAYSIKVADHIVAISEFTKKDIINNYQISENKISVIYPGFDEDIFKPKLNNKIGKKVLQKYNIKNKYILFLGALKPSKNLERLVESFALLKNRKLNLVIAGKKGWLYQSIFEKVDKLKLQDRVIFTDFILDNEIPYLMSNSEVFVYPSLYEGFGMPVVEAMACGVPVVVSNRGSLPEVVDNAGIIVNPENVGEIVVGINKALRDKSMYVKRGLERARHFNWDESAKKIIKILEKYN